MSMLPCIINDIWGYFVLCALNLCAIGDSTVLGQGPGGGGGGGNCPPRPPHSLRPCVVGK